VLRILIRLQLLFLIPVVLVILLLLAEAFLLPGIFSRRGQKAEPTVWRMGAELV